MKERISSEAQLLEHHLGRYLFQLPPLSSGASALTFGQIFMTLQDNKGPLDIIDYSLAKPSLERVFLRFAKEQDEEDEEEEENQVPQQQRFPAVPLQAGASFAADPRASLLA